MVAVNHLKRQTDAQFMRAWGGALGRDAAGWWIDLGPAGICAWTMPAAMAKAVHGVLADHGLCAPVMCLDAGGERMLLFGAADAMPSPNQNIAINRGHVAYRFAGPIRLADLGGGDWYADARPDVSFAPLSAVVEAIRAATPIAVERVGVGSEPVPPVREAALASEESEADRCAL